MIDIDSIGKRIKEERKYIMKISQEKMAEDLNMYQADISNMEKSKSGSGITDLIKLDIIADYFKIPLETLLFGREDKNMLKYHGEQMKLKMSKKKMTKAHKEILLRLTGQRDKEEINSAWIHECGPYTIYTLVERQITFGHKSKIVDGKIINPESILSKLHTYVFLGAELIGVMVADPTTVMQHVFQPSLQQLQMMIPWDVLDVTDTWRTLNPYWALWMFSEEGQEKEEYYDKMFKRMDVIRQSGEDRPILYIENVYVREDCRKNGIFRLYIDLLKMMFDGCIIWLNMEPTSGDELDQEYNCVPSYSVSELGQLNMNAYIAEKVGFTIDPDTWHRKAEKIDENGNISIENVLVRKCAYYLPSPIRKILENDGDLVMQGRAKQKVMQSPNRTQSGGTIDFNHGYIGKDFASEIKASFPNGEYYYATVVAKQDGSKRYVVSHSSLLSGSKEWIIEEYSALEEVSDSQYKNDLLMADNLISMADVSIPSSED